MGQVRLNLTEFVFNARHDVPRQVDHLAKSRLSCVAGLRCWEHNLILKVQCHLIECLVLGNGVDGDVFYYKWRVVCYDAMNVKYVCYIKKFIILL